MSFYHFTFFSQTYNILHIRKVKYVIDSNYNYIELVEMSENIRNLVDKHHDIIENATDIVAGKLSNVVYQTYYQLTSDKNSEMTSDDYNYIRDTIIKELDS